MLHRFRRATSSVATTKTTSSDRSAISCTLHGSRGLSCFAPLPHYHYPPKNVPDRRLLVSAKNVLSLRSLQSGRRRASQFPPNHLPKSKAALLSFPRTPAPPRPYRKLLNKQFSLLAPIAYTTQEDHSYRARHVVFSQSTVTGYYLCVCTPQPDPPCLPTAHRGAEPFRLSVCLSVSPSRVVRTISRSVSQSVTPSVRLLPPHCRSSAHDAP